MEDKLFTPVPVNDTQKENKGNFWNTIKNIAGYVFDINNTRLKNRSIELDNGKGLFGKIVDIATLPAVKKSTKTREESNKQKNSFAVPGAVMSIDPRVVEDKKEKLQQDINTIMGKRDSDIARLKLLEGRPEYADEYINTKKSIEKSYDEGMNIYNTKYKEIEDLSKKVQAQELMNDPISNYFKTPEKRDSYISKTILPLMYDLQGNSTATTPEDKTAQMRARLTVAQMTNDYVKNVVQNGVKTGKYNSIEDGLDDEFVRGYIADVGKATYDVIKNNYAEIVNPDGTINDKKIENILLKDSTRNDATTKFDKYVRGQHTSGEQDYRKKIYDDSGIVGKIIGLGQRGISAVTEGYKNKEQGKRLESRKQAIDILDTDTDNYRAKLQLAGTLPSQIQKSIADVAGHKSFLDMVGNLVDEDPLGTAMFLASIPVSFGGSTLLKLPTVAKYMKAGQIIETVGDINRFRKSQILAKGLETFEQIIRGIPLDSAITHRTKEPTPGINVFLNGAMGLFKGNVLAPSDSIMKDVLSQGTNESKAAKLKELIPGFNTTDFTDTALLRKNISKHLANNPKTLYTVYANSVKNVVNKTNDINALEGIVSTAKNIEGDGTSQIGGIFKNRLDEIDGLIKKYKSTPTEDGLNNIKKGLSDILDSYSPETYNAILHNRLQVELKKDAVAEIYDEVLKDTGREDLAVHTAFASVFGKTKTVDGLISMVDKALPGGGDVLRISGLGDDITNKTNALKKMVTETNLFDMYNKGNEITAKIIEGESRLDDTLRSGVDFIQNIKNDNKLSRIGLSNFDSALYKEVDPVNISKTQGYLGNMVRAMQTSNADEVVKNFDSIMDIIHGNLPKEVGNKISAEDFKKLVIDYINGDGVKKYDMFESLTDEGKGPIAMAIKDVDDAFDGIFDASNIVADTEKVDNMREALSLMNISSEVGGKIDFTKLNNLNEYQDLLLNGTFAPSLRTTAVEIYNGIKSGGKYVPTIHAAYFSPYGKSLLDTVMEGVKGYTTEYMKTLFEKSQSKNRDIIEMLPRFFSNGEVSFNIKIGGNTVSLRNVSDAVDVRVTEDKISMGRINGGMVYMNSVSLMKSIMSQPENRENAMKVYSEAMNTLFKDIKGTAGKNAIDSIVTLTEKDTQGEAVVDLFNMVKKRFDDAGIPSMDVIDLIHPLFYNPEEYILGVSKINELTKKVDTITRVILDRHTWMYADDASTMIKLSNLDSTVNYTKPLKGSDGKMMPDDFDFMGGGAVFRNENAKKINNFVRDALESYNGARFKIPGGIADAYIYDMGGYFITKKGMNYSNSMVDNFTQEILDTAQNILKSKGADAETIERVMGGLDNMVTGLLKYKNDGKIIDLNTTIESVIDYAKKNGVYDEGIDVMLQEFKASYEKNAESILTDMYVSRMNKILNKTDKAIQEPSKFIETPLHQEARKYKSAEEFRKSQKQYIHVTTKDGYEKINSEGFKLGLGKQSKGMTKGKGVRLYDNLEHVGIFRRSSQFYDDGENISQLTSAYLNGKIFDIGNNDILKFTSDKKNIENLKNEGYIGVTGRENLYTKGKGIDSIIKTKPIFIFDDSGIKNMKQIEQIREEAQQGLDQSLDDVIKKLEDEKELRNKISAIEQKGRENMFVRSMVAVDNLNASNMKAIISKMGDDEAESYLKFMGFDSGDIDKIVKGKKISNKEIYTATKNLINDGKMTVYDAIQVPAYKKAMKEIFDEQSETIKNGDWITVNDKGNVVLGENNDARSRFRKLGINIAVAGTKDPEIQGILKNRAERGAKMSDDHLFRLGKANKKISREAYIRNARDELGELSSKKDISVNRLVDIAKDVFDEAKHTDKTSLKLNDVEQKFYDELLKYKKDVSKMRFGLPSGLTTELGDYMRGFSTTPKQMKKNIINRLTGQRTLFDDKEMLRLHDKMGAKGDTAFLRDIFYGGLFDKSIIRGVTSWTTQAAMFFMFGPQAANKVIQQGINNITNAQGALKGFMYDGDKLDNLVDYIYTKIDFKFIEGAILEATRGSKSVEGGVMEVLKQKKGLGHMISKGLQDMNSLNWGDKGTKMAAMRSAVINAFYDTFEIGGTKAVDDFLDKVSDMQDFLEKYGIKEFDLFDRNRISSKMFEMSEKYGEKLSDIWSKYDDFALFYGKQVRDIKAKVRNGLAVFYVTDNVPELSSIRFVEKARYMFALKKRAIGKFGEYGYKVAHDIRRMGMRTFLSEAVKGKIPVLNQIAAEVLMGLRISRANSRLTGEEMNIMNTLEYIAIPMTVLYMTVGEAIRTGIHTSQDLKEIRGAAIDGGADPDALIGSMTPYVAGLFDFIGGLTSTAFLFQENLAAGFKKARDTGSAMEDGKFVKGAEARLKYNFLRAITKSFTSDYKGYNFMTDRDGKLTTNIMEYIFNAQSKTRKDLNRDISKQYQTLGIGAGGMGYVLKSYFEDLLPKFVLGEQSSSADQQILLRTLKGYTKEMGFDLFTDEFALTRNSQKFMEGIDNYNMVMIQDAIRNNKDKISLEGDVMNMSETELMQKMIEGSVINNTMPSFFFKHVLDGLNGQLGISSVSKKVTEEVMESTGEKMVLEQIADKMRDQYESAKGKQKPESMLKKMIEVSSNLGTRYILSDYMTALNTSYIKKLKKEYGLEHPDYKIGTPIIDSVRSSIPENEIKYFADLYNFENNLAKEARGFIGGNQDIGISLTMNAIEKDQNSPTKGKFTFQMQNVYTANWFRENLQKEGILSDEAIDPISFHRRSVINIINKSADYSDEAKIGMFKSITNMFSGYIKNIDEAIPEPYTNTVARMGVAFSIAPFFDEINNYDKEGVKKIVDAIGDGSNVNPLVSMVDSMTSSNPADVETAFEYASGMNLHPSSGGKKLPDAKIEKAKKNASKLLDDYNAANKFAKKLGDMGYPITGVKAKYGISKGKVYEVDIKPVKIEVPQVPLTEIKEVPGESQKTESLNVAERKTQMRGVLTAKYSPKAIKKSRSSTSKMKF